MAGIKFRSGSLVLYKGQAARILKMGAKIEIELPESKTVRVRPKDIALLHSGPLESLDELAPLAGEVETAWELLMGSEPTLAELAELAYGEYSPATAWAAWQLVVDGTYFRGSPDALTVRTAEEIAQERAAREAKAAEERAWEAFVGRARAGQILPEDERYLKEVTALALDQQDSSRLLSQLGRTPSPQNAHRLLLELGYWEPTVNPYPRRLRMVTSPSQLALPELPEIERVDLTHLAAYAIDDADNQDPDDALSLDGERLWVHVADVAALVSPDSPVDLDARDRGATLYAPEGIVPMLPLGAVQTLGLGLTDISPALSFGLDLAQGEITGVEVVASWVRVTRLSYEEVDERLEEEPFRSLYQLAQAYEAGRAERGSIQIELPEVKIWVQEGKVGIRPLPPFRSRVLVREAMLMTGEAVAHFALKRDIPLPFTSQGPPEFYTEIEDPESLSGMYALRRTLKPGQQSNIPAPHTGLGMDVYVQCTSPLRRYLDLVVHQQLHAYLRGDKLLGFSAILDRIGAATSGSSSTRQAERLSRRHWTLVYLLQHPDWSGEGIVVGSRGRRTTVLIPELSLEPRLHLRASPPLNSRVTLSLRGVNLAELEAQFEVTGRP